MIHIENFLLNKMQESYENKEYEVLIHKRKSQVKKSREGS